MRTSVHIARTILKSGERSFVKLILRLATATIAISLAIMILTISIISGFENDISKKIFDFWGHITVKDINNRGSLENLPMDSIDIYTSRIDEITGIEYMAMNARGEFSSRKTKGGVKSTQEFIHLPAVLRSKDEMDGVRLRGLSSNVENVHFLNAYLTEGEWISPDAEENEIILSKSTARRIKVNPGENLIAHIIYDGKQIPKRFRISGIYSTGLEEFDARIAVVDIDFIRDIVGWGTDEAGGISVLVDNINDIDGITDYLNYELLPQNLYAESIKSEMRPLFEWLGLQDVNKILILSLLTIVCMINMTTVLIILILERSRMIGILKSIGSDNRLLREVFLYYAGYILLRALIIGNVIGLGISVLQYYTHLIPLDEVNYYLSYVPIKFEWSQFLLLNISSFALTLLFMLLPTALIARIKPVKVLKFD